MRRWLRRERSERDEDKQEKTKYGKQKHLYVSVFQKKSNLHKNVLGIFRINAAHFKHGEPGLHEEHEEHANAVMAITETLFQIL